MLRNRKADDQAKQRTPELAAERAAVSKLHNAAHNGKGQSAEYIAAAKALNEKLDALGLHALMKVEK